MKWAYLRGRRPRTAFTIVEVMITLGVSGVILTASIAVFNGRRASTEFQQTMYDLQSKFQSYETEASTSKLPSDSYVCAESTSPYNGEQHPYLTPSTPTADSQSNQACIYLGKAIQVIPGGDTIYAYPVLGLRTTSSGDFPATPGQANPDPALDVTGKNWYLVDNYILLNNAQVVSARFSGSTTEQDFLAIYASLQSSNPGSQAAAFSRNVSFSPGDAQSTKLRDCVEEINCGTAQPLTTAWNLCVQDDSGTRKAELSLKSSSTGVTVSLNLAGCP